MWDKELLNRTEEAFSDFDNSALSELNFVCMKHSGYDKFGIITRSDIVNKTWSIVDRDNHEVYTFNSLSDLLADGWIVD